MSFRSDLIPLAIAITPEEETKSIFDIWKAKKACKTASTFHFVCRMKVKSERVHLTAAKIISHLT
jgi:hypothetical protein